MSRGQRGLGLGRLARYREGSGRPGRQGRAEVGGHGGDGPLLRLQQLPDLLPRRSRSEGDGLGKGLQGTFFPFPALFSATWGMKSVDDPNE